MPVQPLRAALLLTGALLVAACGTTSATPPTPPADPTPPVDPAAGPAPAAEPVPTAGEVRPHEVSLVADFGPLPDGSGDAVVTTTWTTDAHGTVHLTIDTPAGLAEQHISTDEEHWWWLHPEVRPTIADAEWVHFDLRVVEAAGAELPDVVAEARQPPPQPDDMAVGLEVAGRQVLAVEDVGEDEVHLTVAGIERPVVHRRRALPADTSIGVPVAAVDVRELPDVLRW